MKEQNIESRLKSSGVVVSADVREKVVSKIDQSLRQKQRQDDRRVVFAGLFSLLLVGLTFLVIASWQHRQIIRVITADISQAAESQPVDDKER